MACAGTLDLTHYFDLISEAYHSYVLSESRYLVLYGGAGSGKSYTAAQKLILRILTEPGHRFYVLRKVGDSSRNSTFALIRDCLLDYQFIGVAGQPDRFKINQKEMKFTYLQNGNTIQCQGLDDPEKLKSIQKPTGFWLEEATEFTPKDIREINRRLRGQLSNYKQIILTFNPISSLHHLRERFFTSPRSVTERATGRLTIFKSTYEDNDFLDDEYIEELLAETDPTEYQVYTKGEWGILRNVIFGPPIMIDEKPLGLKDKIYGLDFGYTAETAIGEYKFSGSDKDLLVFERELLYEKHLTADDLVARLISLKVDKHCPIYCDSADPGGIESLYDAGFNAKPCWKAQGSVNASIRFVKGLKIHGYPENVHFNQEAETYRWQTDKNGNVLEKELDKHNHGMKARMYALMTHLNHAGWLESFNPRALGVA